MDDHSRLRNDAGEVAGHEPSSRDDRDEHEYFGQDDWYNDGDDNSDSNIEECKTTDEAAGLLGLDHMLRFAHVYGIMAEGEDSETDGDWDITDEEDDNRHGGTTGHMAVTNDLSGSEAPTDEALERDIYYRFFVHARDRKNQTADRTLPKVPSDEGTELMHDGVFGADPYYADKRKNRRTSLPSKLLWRELARRPRGTESRAATSFLGQDMLPLSSMDRVLHHEYRVYSGQFSDDGNFFFTTAQDYCARMYDTSNPYDWKFYRSTEHTEGSWTITDGALSPDNRFLALSTIDSVVALSGIDHDSSAETILDFGRGPTRTSMHFGIWSLRFSGDGREIIAGTSASSVIVYDLATQQQTLHLRKHADDVNAVCYGDPLSPHILYSGSDDTTVRVWDRRSMSDGREAGCFLGHTEGVTYVDSKGDGRYVLSNGKDQSMKLWDLRKMHSTSRLESIDPLQWSTKFDYRSERFMDDDYIRHPYDCSVVTFRGHSVHRTLIRCHFSPPNASNGRYVYTGSEDGKVWIYNLDATVAGVINVASLTDPTSVGKRGRAPAEVSTTNEGSNPSTTTTGTSTQDRDARPRRGTATRTKLPPWSTCVRDASWHPDAPVIAATAWAGYRPSTTTWSGYGMASGTCTVHSWGRNDDFAEGGDEGDIFFDEELRRIGVQGYRKKAGPMLYE
ncbi:hypothetical protein KEM56_002021 [Ascosphaera pollenicola]|nr:hypothetical protein KEM56_002021 [Ascosphaera pollenicola]